MNPKEGTQMTDSPVDEVIAAFLDHLENGGPEASLDHLTEDERTEATELIDLIKDARGVDFYRSRPSLDAVLAGTEFEHQLDPGVTVGLSIDAVRTDVVSSLGSASEPIADGAAQNEGIRSDAVVRFGSLRIRIQFRNDITTSVGLSQVDPQAAARPVFGRFPDTVAVVLVIGDQELSSVAIGPFDIDDFIGAPDGQVHQPRITRPILSLYDTLRRLVDELAPDLTGDNAIAGHETVELDDIIRTECATACAAVVAEGKKARTEAKKETWADFDKAAFLASLVQDAGSGELSEADLDARLTQAEAA
jgi:hypothetical protein